METTIKEFLVKEGGQKHKNFPCYCIKKRRNNKILRIKDEKDNWHENKEDIEEVFLSYFPNLFLRPTLQTRIGFFRQWK